MYHSFAAYEQDFRAWWASKQFPEVGPLTCDFLTHVTRPDAPPLVLTIVEFDDEKVILDANHPLAGKDLIFEIELVEILE